MGAVHDTVVEAVAGWIVSGRYPAGASLPVEQSLCDTLGASRTAVREALKTLKAKGLVTIAPRIGTRVRPTSDWNLFDPAVMAWQMSGTLTPSLVEDLVRFRLLIEPAAAELAAERASARDIASLEAAYAGMAGFGEDLDRYIEADLAYHTALLGAARNVFLSRLAPVVGAVLRLSFVHSVLSPASARASLPRHRAIVDAIAAGDGATARQVITALILAAEADLATRLAANPAPERIPTP